VIVGSSLKVGGVWNAPLDERACEAFIEACHAAS
jgi:predicted TIM-barrel enzyme